VDAVPLEQDRRPFAPIHALGGLGLATVVGMALGLLGPNGVGKCALVRILMRLSGFDSGRVQEAAYDAVHGRAPVRARSRVEDATLSDSVAVLARSGVAETVAEPEQCVVGAPARSGAGSMPEGGRASDLVRICADE
jgi:ABC-type multidrug transport system ATPase subunit